MTLKEKKTMIKWISLFIGWIGACVMIAAFYPCNIALGIWIIVVGIVMRFNKENYRKWYNRVYGTDF